MQPGVAGAERGHRPVVGPVRAVAHLGIGDGEQRRAQRGEHDLVAEAEQVEGDAALGRVHAAERGVPLRPALDQLVAERDERVALVAAVCARPPGRARCSPPVSGGRRSRTAGSAWSVRNARPSPSRASRRRRSLGHRRTRREPRTRAVVQSQRAGRRLGHPIRHRPRRRAARRGDHQPSAARAVPRLASNGSTARSTRSSRWSTERAFAEADAADARRAAGDELPPLHGLPITIKDAIETAGIRSTGGAVELADHVPAADAARRRPAARRRGDRVRQDQPAALVGRRAELQRDVRHDEQPVGHVTRVPVARRAARPSRSPPASPRSSWAPTSVARCASRRTAAARSGHKPSYGVVPQRGYLDSVGGGTTDADINVFGPMARSAADLDLLLGVLAGPVPSDAPAWRVELPEPTVDVARRRTAGDVARRSGRARASGRWSTCCAASPTRPAPPARRSPRCARRSTRPSSSTCSTQLIGPAVSVSSPPRGRRRDGRIARRLAARRPPPRRAAGVVGRVVRGLRRAARRR